MRFYLGAHHAHWLEKVDVPLFVSHNTLTRRRRLPRARHGWALDSGAFSDIAGHGEFTTTPAGYVAAVERYRDDIGRLEWVAPQDHMCEPWVLARSKIATTVAAAQRWTVDNFLRLREIGPTLPIIPVLQGQSVDDYRRCVERYDRAGVDLSGEATVGVGSVCRRQATGEIAAIIAALSADGLALHGFGVKLDGLRRYGWCLTSADSMAWSYWGRRTRPCPHSRTRSSCANCLPYALEWRHRVVDAPGRAPIQLTLEGRCGG